MEKHYISAEELLVDSFKLAEKIYLSGFQPDFIVGVWRGGTPIGIAIQEYLDVIGLKTNHIAIRASSYYEIDDQDQQVAVHGLEYVMNNTSVDSKLLLVDDVFDTGRSVNTILDHIQNNADSNIPGDLRIATPWYKPARNRTNLQPDFFLYETEKWLVFPHELKGLTIEEISKNKTAIADAIVRHLPPD